MNCLTLSALAGRIGLAIIVTTVPQRMEIRFMPAYDYRCNDCKRRVVLKYKTYADYDNAVPVCPNCQSKNLTRLISRVAIAKSESSRFSSLDDDTMMDDLADADPATLGRYMR